nr:hypothetical protein BaRGS_016752 [Batillaria attramentaria]
MKTSLTEDFTCSSGEERVPYTLVCDFRQDCSDGSDESFCVFQPCSSDESLCQWKPSKIKESLPMVVDFDGHGKRTTIEYKWPQGLAKDQSPCPETHFRCPGDEIMCLPVFVRCNGVRDCPGELRYLDASESDVNPAHLGHNMMLIFLSLARCRLASFHNTTFPNLRVLDLSDNDLHVISSHQLFTLRHLRVLILAGNPLKWSAPSEAGVFNSTLHTNLRSLDLSRTVLTEVGDSTFSHVPNLQVLNLSGAGVERVSGGGFQLLEDLRVLDVRNCPVSELSRGLFRGVHPLQTLYADEFTLCCPAMLPEGFNPNDCHAPGGVISSCDQLIGQNIFRVFLSFVAVCGLVGNLGSLVVRRLLQRNSDRTNLGTFVTHLSVSDFVVNMHLVVILIADRVFEGRYLWEDASQEQPARNYVLAVRAVLNTIVLVFVAAGQMLVSFSNAHENILALSLHPGHAALHGADGGRSLQRLFFVALAIAVVLIVTVSMPDDLHHLHSVVKTVPES